MGNDDEIKHLIRRESESFLKNALVESKGKGAAYDLTAEFARTRRNKSFVVIGATAITIAVLGVAAVAVTRAIERNIARAPVDVAAFEDLHLKDILDSSKRNEADLDRAKLELSQLDGDLESGLETADRDYRSSVESIRARALGGADESRSIARAAATKDAVQRKLRVDYSVAAAAKREEIAAAQKRIDQYDSRSLAQAKEEQSTLANERVAFDIEKKQQAQFYESRIAEIEAARDRDMADLTRQRNELAASITARYNPSFQDSLSTSLLSGWSRPTDAPLAPFHPYLGPAGILDSTAQTALDASFGNLEYLSSKLKAVPYINSVPTALSRIEGEARLSVSAYRAALQAAGSGLESRDKTIAELKARAEAAENGLNRYRAAVAAYARENRESGYVIDVGDGAQLLVCLDPGVTVKDGSVGYVVHGDTAVATVAFSLGGGSVYARVVKIEEGKKPEVFDSILVSASPEAAQ
jgi:hypothetical protein